MIAALIGLPLAGAAILLIGGRRTNAWGHLLAVVLSWSAFVVGVLQFIAMLGKAGEERVFTQHLADWISVGKFTAGLDLRLDPLSIAFVLLITGVGSLIHVYSIGYMAHDENRRKFFAYLNFFVAAMLLLVLADNYLLLYVGWEGVGLASYLLISFWQHKPSAATAGKKAFVANRVGDAGLSIAVMLMFTTLGTLSIDGVAEAVGSADQTKVTWIGLALLLAACGKSAQFPLQSWLLDAMEGPTPVSALIHAATMVTAGVYLITRAHAVFDLSEVARTAVIVVGAITLLLGAFIGTAKDDIKKGLAGSTMSQIGYMVLGSGLGPVGYVFAIFHLLTHGMFKAGLFLGAGSVMHGMHDDVNMRHYGALRGAMKITSVTFILGFLAIIGIPPFAGFFSKDEIISAAFGTNTIAGFAALLGAGVTAFYMTRMVAMTFFGGQRWQEGVHPHESPASMTIPMIVLSIGSVFGGAALLYLGDIEAWLEPVVGFAEPAHPVNANVLLAATLGIVLLGAGYGWRKYAMAAVPVVAPTDVSFLTKAARADAYGDAFNEAVLMRPGQQVMASVAAFDNAVVDGAVRLVPRLLRGSSEFTRKGQTGYARSYALTMLTGAAALVAVLLLVRL